tara:strand:- start:21839 stop:23044 length:1206 start_codon:yes stop_codon:yes gene_type:complete
MANAVITGMGILSPIGNNLNEVTQSLKTGKSGISKNQEYKELGMKSTISGSISIDLSEIIERKILRFMSKASAFAYIAAKEAILCSGIELDKIDLTRVGVVAGSGGASPEAQIIASDTARNKNPKRIGPYAVTKTMGSTVSASLGTFFKTQGVNYSISSACSTSAHCIGHAAQLIESGLQDVIIAGGGEDDHWTSSSLFDAMGALSSKYNEEPERASRPFDTSRDGFVIAAGAGIVIIEDEAHAKSRGANIIASLKGYAANSDGYDMVAPSGEGAKRCMKKALQQVKNVDYINAHGTGTLLGDVAELQAIKDTFDSHIPIITSTKSLTGHSLGAAGAQEAIYSLLMMKNNFISPSINIDEVITEGKGLSINKDYLEKEIRTVMSNSFGFGGTNASLVFTKY